MELNKIINGDCVEKMKELSENSVDLICTDPPYGIGFMGKDWDTFKPDFLVKNVKKSRGSGTHAGMESPAQSAARYDHSTGGASRFREWFTGISIEMLRVLKPGAFAFVCIGARQDSVAAIITAMTEAGFKTDFTSLFWTYATGFPKAANISKAIDKRLGNKRTGKIRTDGKGTISESGIYRINNSDSPMKKVFEDGEPVSEQAKALNGSYTGFQPKPAIEVIVVAMKPLSEKTSIDQAMKNGKGITWLDDARIPYRDQEDMEKSTVGFGQQNDKSEIYELGHKEIMQGGQDANGRFPANLLVSDNVLYEDSKFFDLDHWARSLPFLHVPKATKDEKDKNLDGEEISIQGGGGINNLDAGGKFGSIKTSKVNSHPTVKPLKLMQYLIILGSREKDIVLDPFNGSGTTCVASKELGRNYIGIEKEKEYCDIAEARLKEIQLSLWS